MMPFTRFPGPLAEKHPKALSSCLTVGMVFLGLKASAFFTTNKRHVFGAKKINFVLSDHKTEDQKCYSLSRPSRLFCSLSALCPLNPAMCSARWTVCLRILPPAEPRLTRKTSFWDFPPCETSCIFFLFCTVATGTWKDLKMALWPFPDLWAAPQFPATGPQRAL